MHPLQIIASLFIGIYVSVLVIAGLVVLYLAFFGDTVKEKPDSRLLRWPLAIKSCWLEFWDFVDILTSGKRARNFMEEIWKSGP